MRINYTLVYEHIILTGQHTIILLLCCVNQFILIDETCLVICTDAYNIISYVLYHILIAQALGCEKHMYVYNTVRTVFFAYTHIYVQWDLFMEDTLGPANSSTIERLSTLQR